MDISSTWGNTEQATTSKEKMSRGKMSKRRGLGSEIRKVSAFKEKPVLQKAQEYLISGNYLWNAGIFIWKAKSLQKAFEKYAPEIDLLIKSGKTFYNTPGEADFILKNYPNSPNVSIDYAILEKVDNIYTIPADIGWSDFGTWASLHVVGDKDDAQNMINVEAINLKDTANCILSIYLKIRQQ